MTHVKEYIDINILGRFMRQSLFHLKWLTITIIVG